MMMTIQTKETQEVTKLENRLEVDNSRVHSPKQIYKTMTAVPAHRKMTNRADTAGRSYQLRRITGTAMAMRNVTHAE